MFLFHLFHKTEVDVHVQGTVMWRESLQRSIT